MALPQNDFRRDTALRLHSPAAAWPGRAYGFGDSAPAPRTVFEEVVRWTIGGERGALAGRLPAQEREAFLEYYAGLPDVRSEVDVRRYLRGLWHSDIGWVSRWIAEQGRRRPLGLEPVQVLDAGCGFGTYSLLYACMGAEVTAVDLREDRLHVARRRLELFEERTRRSLGLRIERIDVTEDIDALPARTDQAVSSIREAVQHGRRIAPVRREAGSTVPLAFMTPHIRRAASDQEPSTA